ncbi:hypothetical protein SODALDRAFT_333138 [Sodiomyces alkalinus F11]|uniref:Nuclear speckle splicing regulatory protein 1 N-terminal domain-containing protein n=1 Tax=Sodiomyces alkalinus (strain CBS 110278 / VKM F-3762 / F11) TaxID=1314773 RepID=A0A3N2PVL4_SODAK|nr:hypothetical protein SODALDRAFT_333138 [Sodiomyces alkalinus F11]ROT38540.1 hypothetical protein SODALDRAFT_333138 [Sodiomyces alkalinus F11]
MSKSGLSFGLNLTKKPGASKPAPAKRKPLLGGLDDGSDNEDASQPNTGRAQAIGELSGFDLSSSSIEETGARKPKKKNAPPAEPPTALKSKKQPESAMFGDLSSSLASRKHAEAAEDLDPSIYDYDKVYDTFKPQKKKSTAEEEGERKPKYMSSLLAAAAVRKRDALIAEEKKIAREREAEGEEYAEKEKFVTEAYKRQQEENRRIEEEEKRREEEEARKNKTGGMNAFYKGLLDRHDETHRAVMKAAEEKVKSGPAQDDNEPEGSEKEITDVERAKEIIEHGGSVAINEDGQVVDKRQLLGGGLNVTARKQAQAKKEASRPRQESRDNGPRAGFVGAGGKGAMRERQTRMLEQQLEAALKRTREEEEQEREKLERVAKSRKTECDISSARERYLARKREAEEAKKKGLAE